MPQNKYDDEKFFEKYKKMRRSEKGLAGAGEWPSLQKMLPSLKGKRVLDLGCGMGWHCRYAAEQGAKKVIGIDVSAKMLAQAQSKNTAPQIEYLCLSLEEMDFSPNSFDIVFSSLAFHYIEDFGALVEKVAGFLTSGGEFVFSVEHPVFTAEGRQQWIVDSKGTPLYWPVDRYFSEGIRLTEFLGEEVNKYHRTLTTYIQTLLDRGFTLTGFAEPQPTADDLKNITEMEDELRRPMMMIISARKQ